MTGHADDTDDERILLVMRHAHAAHAGGAPDSARQLTVDGEAEAARVGELLARRHVPDAVLASSAVRAAGTAAGVVRGSGSAAEVRTSESLYLASTADVLTEVREADPAARTVLVVGHQPAVQEFALSLSDEESDPSYVADIEAHFRPATLAVFRYAGLWAELDFGEAELIDVLTP